jgi:hypothetical protein
MFIRPRNVDKLHVYFIVRLAKWSGVLLMVYVALKISEPATAILF